MNKLKKIILCLLIISLAGCNSWNNEGDDIEIEGKIILDSSGEKWDIYFELNNKKYSCSLSNEFTMGINLNIKNNDIIAIKIQRNSDAGSDWDIIPSTRTYYDVFYYYKNELLYEHNVFSTTKFFYAIYRYDRIKFSNKYRIKSLDKEGEKYYLDFNKSIDNVNYCNCCEKIVHNNKCKIKTGIDYYSALKNNTKKIDGHD